MNKSKRAIVKIFFTGVLALIFNACQCQTKSDKLDALVSTYAEYGKFNGAVLVAEEGEIIYKNGFGLANVEEKISNKPGTKFLLGSVTKQFTAMLIVQLVSENKLKLDVPISTYLPKYPKETGDIVSIHHLLTHTSGIPDFTSFSNFGAIQDSSFTPEELVKLFADSTLEFTPGEKFQYSNSGYILLGYIIEKVSGKSYEEVLQNKILIPLKMTHTGVGHDSTGIKDKALGYNRVGSTFQNARFIDMSVPYAAGAIYSTVEDMYMWDQALYTEKLLPKKYLDLLFEPYIPAFGRGNYGYGWEIGKMPVGSTSDQIQTNYHDGVINGFNAMITRIPSNKSLIVLLNNAGTAPLREMTIAINGILYGKPYMLPKKSVAFSLSEAIERDGGQRALLHYTEIKDSPNYYLNEYEMNTVGYGLLQSGKANEAASVFKLIVEAFPNSFNAYDSYGETLMVIGDTAHAIENYLKSVRLNPGNENGLKVLQESGINTDSLVRKVSIEDLKLLEGNYTAVTDKNWTIEFRVVKGELTGNDRGYRFKLVPAGENRFVNPVDGASLVFDAKDKRAITLMLFGHKFRKVI